MENLINRPLVAEGDGCLPNILTLARQSSIFPSLYIKIIDWFPSVKEFIDYPAFYEGECTNTSRFYTKIESINRLNNRQTTIT